jgi:hypothetical protein
MSGPDENLLANLMWKVAPPEYRPLESSSLRIRTQEIPKCCEQLFPSLRNRKAISEHLDIPAQLRPEWSSMVFLFYLRSYWQAHL